MSEPKSSARHADLSPLDDVIWNALTGPHAHLAIGDDHFKRYPSDIAPFGAVSRADPESIVEAFARLEPGTTIALTTLKPIEPMEGATPIMRAVLHQMLLIEPVRLPLVPTGLLQGLESADVPEMIRLTQATKPGPFGPRTIEMGDYLGIREQGTLVAMAGERLKVPGFTEISAVCVDPACRGRGYARTMMARLALSILDRGDTPFLHVVADNKSAIALYEQIGFALRCQFHLAILKKH